MLRRRQAVALGVLNLPAFGAEVARQFVVDFAVMGIEALGQFFGQGPHERAAVGAGLVFDGMLLQPTEFFFLRVGRMPVVGDAHGPGGAVMAARGAQTAGVLPDGDGKAGAVGQLRDVDGPGSAVVTAGAAAHTEVWVYPRPAAQARRSEGFAKRKGIGAGAFQQVVEEHFQKARHNYASRPSFFIQMALACTTPSRMAWGRGGQPGTLTSTGM